MVYFRSLNLTKSILKTVEVGKNFKFTYDSVLAHDVKFKYYS